MLDKSRRNRILALALPIIGGMTSQNILNLVDTAMVGRLGDEALAAVGLGGFINFMCIAVITGLSSGVQAIAARRYGENKHTETAVPLNGGLLLAITLGIPITIITVLLAPVIYGLLMVDQAVLALGVPYLQWRLAAAVFIGMNFAFRGYWNGINRSGLYLRTLLVMHGINIVLNYCLIFGNFGFPELGVTGAAIGTTVSVICGTAYYFYLGFRHARGNGFLHGVPKPEQLKMMLRQTLPSSLQQFFFAAGLTAMYWIIGMIGTKELAAANVVVNIMLVCILPGIGFGLAAASLAGQALGAGNPNDAKAWGWDVAKLGFVVIALMAMPMWLAPDLIMSVFVKDPDTLAIGRLPLQIVGIAIAFDGVGLILMNALLGVGAASFVMRVSMISQWLFFLPIAWFIGPHLGYGLLAVWAVQFVYRFAQGLIFARKWQGGAWAQIKV